MSCNSCLEEFNDTNNFNINYLIKCSKCSYQICMDCSYKWFIQKKKYICPQCRRYNTYSICKNMNTKYGKKLTRDNLIEKSKYKLVKTKDGQKIFNPDTQRWVYKGSITGQKIINKYTNKLNFKN